MSHDLAPVAVPTEVLENRELQERQRVLQELVGRSAFDRALRARLLSEPKAVLAEHGITFPEQFTVQCIENTHDATIVLPDAIDEVQELSTEELMHVNGGGSASATASPAVSKITPLTTGACVSILVSVAVTVITIMLAD